jgi:hypothetical protein
VTLPRAVSIRCRDFDKINVKRLHLHFKISLDLFDLSQLFWRCAATAASTASGVASGKPSLSATIFIAMPPSGPPIAVASVGAIAPRIDLRFFIAGPPKLAR